MSRLQNTILAGGKAHSADKLAPQVDLKVGGQNGYFTDPVSYVANSAYVKRNLIAILLEAPRGFNDLPNPEVWVSTLKNLVELHAQTIEGLDSTLTVEFIENAVGGGGEMQEDISNVTRARSVPVFTWPEKYGKAINSFFSGWILNLIGDPETKVPRVVSVGDDAPTDLLPDYTGMTVMFIEPDPTHTTVVTSWLSTNMMPKTGGENNGKRDLTAAGEGVVHSIEFTALTQVGAGVDATAQKLLDSLGLTTVNPNNRAAFIEGITADVDGADGGFAAKVEAVADAI